MKAFTSLKIACRTYRNVDLSTPTQLTRQGPINWLRYRQGMMRTDENRDNLIASEKVGQDAIVISNIQDKINADVTVIRPCSTQFKLVGGCEPISLVLSPCTA